MATNPASKEPQRRGPFGCGRGFATRLRRPGEDAERTRGETRRPPERVAPGHRQRASEPMRRPELLRRAEAPRTPSPPLAQRSATTARGLALRTRAPSPIRAAPSLRKCRAPRKPAGPSRPVPTRKPLPQQARPRAAQRGRFAANDDRRGVISAASYSAARRA